VSWELRLRNKAGKAVRRFPKKEQHKIAAALRELNFNPYAGDIEKLEGEENSWRRRIGNYLIFYEVFVKERVIYVFKIERRTSKTY